MSFTVSYATKVRAQQHALSVYPNPSWGLIHGQNYLAVEVQSIDELMRKARATNASALVYSKPDGECFPDATEMQLQQQAAIPFGVMGGKSDEIDIPIFWGDDCEVDKLIGRPFVHGIWDCYSLVRDAFRIGKEGMNAQGLSWSLPPIKLPDVPRDDGWWSKGQDLYVHWMKPAGFVEITAEMARPGDGFLMKIRSEKLNHAGLLVGDNEILHHLPTRLSRREIGGMWFTQIYKWVRYQG